MNPRRLPTIAGALALAVVAAAIGCSKNDSLVLLDLRSSGPLGAPVVRVRLSAKGWATRVVTGSIGPDGFRVGYYGPGNGGAVSVTAEALDAVDCVLGSGSATVAKLAAGATSAPTPLFVRPLPANGCVPDAGMTDAGGDDSGGDDSGVDGGVDSTADAGDDGAGDASADDASAGDASAGDASAGDAGAGDAGVGDAGVGDAGAGDAGAGDAGDGAGDDAAGDAGNAAGDAAGDGAGDVAGIDASDDVGVDSAADAMTGTTADGDADTAADTGTAAAPTGPRPRSAPRR